MISRTLPLADIALEPWAAYARLRSYTPGRASFLFESRAHDTEHGRYTVLGYRPTRCELMPPATDAIALLCDELEAQPEPESLALALAAGRFGFVSYTSATRTHQIPLSDDEGPGGVFVLGAIVALFDHQEGTVTVAGRKQGNVVERCIWEMQNGPTPEPLAPLDAGAEPAALRAFLSDEKLVAKAKRAQPLLEELGGMQLAQTFVATGAADPFVVYRALRELAPGAAMFFVDTGNSPVAPRLQVLGASDHVLHLRRTGGGESARTAVARALPHPVTAGSGGVEAARWAPRLEETSRRLYGGAIGWLCPGGAASFVLGERVIIEQDGTFEHAVAVAVPAGDVSALGTEARAAAAPALAAIAAGQRAHG